MRDSIPDAALDAVCARWVVWHRMHRLIAPSVPKNMLARMQPGKVRRAPAIGLSRGLSLLNLAINAQPDSPAKFSFLILYLYPARSVKEAAEAQGITRDAFYRRVRRFRRRVWAAACALDRTQAQREPGHMAMAC